MISAVNNESRSGFFGRVDGQHCHWLQRMTQNDADRRVLERDNAFSDVSMQKEQLAGITGQLVVILSGHVFSGQHSLGETTSTQSTGTFTDPVAGRFWLVPVIRCRQANQSRLQYPLFMNNGDNSSQYL